jgi:uncharacterized membrane protein YccC
MRRNTFARQALHHARVATAVAQARPAYAAGIRGALATVVALASAASALLAVAVGGHLWLAVPVSFTVAFACGLARVWPDVGPGFGVAILVTFAISLAVPAGSVSSGLMRGLWIAVGGSWAMLIAIVLWPLRPYRPVRLGVAACYRARADYLDDLSRHTTPEQRRATGEYKAHVVSVRAAIENEDDSAAPLVEWAGDSIRDVAAPRDGVYTDQIAALLDRMYDYAAAAVSTVATLNSGRNTSDTGDPEDVVGVGDLRPPRSRLFSLQAIVRADSVVLQHALRVAIVTSVAVLLTGLLHLNHGYWVTLTAVVILQPYSGATNQKAFQRVLGTILGGVVAAALSALFHSFAAIIILVALFTFLCVALLPVNYGAYAIFGTPAFVLLAEASVGDWHLSGIRIMNTLIGGALALIGSRVLWPSAEWSRLPDYTSAATTQRLTLSCRSRRPRIAFSMILQMP